VAGPVTSWAHTPDGAAPLRSVRLTGTGAPEDDVVDPRTGRRECGDEWRLLDPFPADQALQAGPVSVVRGHGEYWAGPDWTDALARLLGEPVAATASSAADEQGHGQAFEQVGEAQPARVGDGAGAGQHVAPRPRGERDGGVAPPLGGLPDR
jgi:hypothetical protein